MLFDERYAFLQDPCHEALGDVIEIEDENRFECADVAVHSPRGVVSHPCDFSYGVSLKMKLDNNFFVRHASARVQDGAGSGNNDCGLLLSPADEL